LGRSQVARRAARILNVIRGARILLVNDIPEEMSHVINIFGELGLNVHVELRPKMRFQSWAITASPL